MKIFMLNTENDFSLMYNSCEWWRMEVLISWVTLAVFVTFCCKTFFLTNTMMVHFAALILCWSTFQQILWYWLLCTIFWPKSCFLHSYNSSDDFYLQVAILSELETIQLLSYRSRISVSTVSLASSFCGVPEREIAPTVCKLSLNAAVI